MQLLFKDNMLFNGNTVFFVFVCFFVDCCFTCVKGICLIQVNDKKN